MLFFPALLFTAAAEKCKAPENFYILYSETLLDLHWDPVPAVAGYNIYTSDKPNLPRARKKKVNNKLVTSGPHFSYLWDVENRKRVRRIKGYVHYITITAVCSLNGKESESGFSKEIDNNYFADFRNIDTKKEIIKTFINVQKTPFLPVKKVKNKRGQFIKFMEGPGRKLHEQIQKHIDPRRTGGCAPVSTILVKLMKEWGLEAYRIEGSFIKEFHTFVIINIGGNEYILDFTADQFVPGVTPVFFPRDYAHINDNGKLSRSGTPVYKIGKIYTAEQTKLSGRKQAELYKKIYDEVRNAEYK